MKRFAILGYPLGHTLSPKLHRLLAEQLGEQMEYSICAIPPEELDKIFDRFHKSDRSRSLDKEGVGLGLYIVKTILNSLKETITVTSENGVTEFTFTLTLAE